MTALHIEARRIAFETQIGTDTRIFPLDPIVESDGTFKGYWNERTDAAWLGFQMAFDLIGGTRRMTRELFEQTIEGDDNYHLGTIEIDGEFNRYIDDGTHNAWLWFQLGRNSTSAKIVTTVGCFDAAYVEGLTEALAETTDARLKDLVERRLLYAHSELLELLEQTP